MAVETPKGSKPNAMGQLLESGEAGIGMTTNPLARIWRTMVYRRNITIMRWDKLATAYQEASNHLTGKYGRSWLKSNLTRTLAKDSITFPSLLQGAFILGYNRIEITIKAANIDKRGRVLYSDEITIPINNTFELHSEPPANTE